MIDWLLDRPLARLAILADRRDVLGAAKGEAGGIQERAAPERERRDPGEEGLPWAR